MKQAGVGVCFFTEQNQPLEFISTGYFGASYQKQGAQMQKEGILYFLRGNFGRFRLPWKGHADAWN